jgi:mevalonate kinase
MTSEQPQTTAPSPSGTAAAAPRRQSQAAARPVVVSTPGKLILMGEHAVVYGRPALVAAIDLRLRATFAPATPAATTATAPPDAAAVDIDIDLPGLPHHTTASWADVLAYAQAARDGWTAYAAHPDVAGFLAMRGGDPAHIVKAALGEVAAALGETAATAPRLRLRLDSALPIGSGFGSSAAAAVAVVAGYAAWRSAAGDDLAPAAPALDQAAIERLALDAERRQHGLPSGVDTATSLYGGLLWARRLPDGGGLASERLAPGSPLLERLRVYHTGMPPESTGEVVAAVRARRDREPAAVDRLFDRMAAAAGQLRAQLALPEEEPHQVVALLREHQACLEELGVVPHPVRALVRQVEAAGGAAKVSGAGSIAGPGAGSLLVYHPEGPATIAGWRFMDRCTLHSVHLGAGGFRREFP